MARTPLMSRPAPAVALLLLVVNDHLLKGAALLPAPLTGKLSDLAGLFFFPILLVAITRCSATLACLATALAFSAIKLHPGANAIANHLWGTVALDPTDLIALISLPLAALWLRRQREAPARPSRLEYPAVFIAAVASIATSAAPPPIYDMPRQYPMWSFADPRDAVVGCVFARVWVAKSGKQGLGLGLRAESRCEVPVRLKLSGSLAITQDERMRRSEQIALSAPTLTLAPGQLERVYIPVAFDNERAWNEGSRVALLSMRWSVSGADGDSPQHVEQSALLRHVRPADHRVRKLRDPQERP